MKTETISVESDNELHILGLISDLMGASMPFHEVITMVLRFASAMMRADGSSLLLIDRKEGNRIFFIAIGEGPDTLKRVTLTEGEGTAGFVAETGLPLVVSDVAREPRFSSRLYQMTGFQARSLACVPLRVRGELRGAMEVVSQEVGSFAEEDLDRLAAIAGPAAIMIDHGRLIHEIKGLHDKLAEANRLKTEFLAIMTHELRTPISIVIGNLDLFLGGYLGELSSRQRESLKTALRNSGEALNLVSSILDLSRSEASQSVVRVEEFRIEDLWADLESLFRIGLSGKEVDLSWEVKAPLPALKTDKLKVKEILGNIVFNAVKFTERGKIRVSASEVQGGEGVEIEVKDTGVGIPQEFLAVIFEPFRQVGGAVTTSHGGVGLGLAIAKKLLNLLHGKVEVESEVGKGSTFRITIPAHYSV